MQVQDVMSVQVLLGTAAGTKRPQPQEQLCAESMFLAATATVSNHSLLKLPITFCTRSCKLYNVAALHSGGQ